MRHSAAGLATARDTTVSNSPSARKSTIVGFNRIDILQPQLDRGLAHKSNSTLAAINQRESDVGTRDCERHTRQTRTGTQVQHTGPAQQR